MRLQAIREGLAERLSEVQGLRAISHPADSIPAGTATVATVSPDNTYIDIHQAFVGGLAFVRLTVTLWVQANDLRAAMTRLDALCSSGSEVTGSAIDALMDGDRTLGGACADLIVDDVTNVRSEILADGARYVCADLGVRVLVGRT